MSSNIACWLTILFVTSPVLVQSANFLSLATLTNVIGGLTDIFALDSSEKNGTLPEDATLNITQLANKYGYVLEEHTVETEDEYILHMHRIPVRSNKTNKVVFLMHGLMESSDCWLLQGPGYALGYILADQGFDVWMGNARGNKHSKAHKTLDPKESEFWDFSWDQIGNYDLPAMIDYITNVTGERIYYIGHSQGTTAFFVMSSLKAEYQEKVKMMFALAPIAWVSNARSPMVKLFTGDSIFKYFLSMLYEPSDLDGVFSSLCKMFLRSCDDKLRLVIANNDRLTNDTMVDIVKGHFPTSSSTLQLIHYSQLVQSGRFCRFDFGSVENLEKYGSSEPPDYDVSKITVPTVLFYSNMDWFSDITDVMLLYNRLPKVIGTHLAYKFDHIDYLYANVSKEFVYTKIIKHIKKFNT